VSTDPAGGLGPALGTSLADGEPCAIDGVPSLSALQLDPLAARAAFLGRWRDVLVTIVDRGTYLDVDDIGGLVDAAFPGADEIFGLLVLARLVRRTDENAASFSWRRLVIDTAPTGHTLRLLALPDTFAAMIALLDTMQAKHRFMVNALTHRYRRDAADEFLDEMRRTIGELRSTLGDAARSGAVLVTRPESVVVSETVRYAEALLGLRLSVVAVVVDALPARKARAIVPAAIVEIAPEDGLFGLARIDPAPMGVEETALALGKLVALGSVSARANKVGTAAKRMRERGQSATHLKSEEGPGPGMRRLAEVLLRTLTIVGGKGGVGKTTVSCGLAISAALENAATGETLLVSTDPAPSLGDALSIQTPRWAQHSPEPLRDLPTLHVWQMDATNAFQGLRDRYRDRIDELFDSLTRRSIDIAHDRAILRDLLALAPPGVDELYALASLGEELETARYARIIIDPAPTGHLLRLLEIPALALDWSHRLMRLIMKYKDVVGLDEAAQDLLNFSRRTRAIELLLRDGARAGLVLVSLDEPIVIDQTKRLARAVAAIGVSTIGEVRNRVSSGRAQTASDPSRPFFVAPELEPPPIGVAAIRDWCERWREQD
jgi:arsenite-transporting ATPase